MSWTDERIDTLKTMWEGGQTASQIAEALGGVSRNAVIGKAHRLGLQSRPSPVKPNDPAEAKPAPKTAAAVAPPAPAPRPAPAPAPEPAAPFDAADDEDEDADDDTAAAAVPATPRPDAPVLRSVGPGGFVRQNPGEQAPPITPAPAAPAGARAAERGDRGQDRACSTSTIASANGRSAIRASPISISAATR